MTDTVTILRHLLVLRDSWHSFAAQLGPRITPMLQHTFSLPAQGQTAELTRWSTGQLAKFEPWIKRLSTWVNGPLARAVGDAAIRDEAMRATCEQLGQFADELISWRTTLHAQARSPAIQGTAPFLDAALLSLLEQIRDFARRVADALGPAALSAPEARRDGSAIELNFTFVPDISVPMANFSAWLKHVRENVQTPPVHDAFEVCLELDSPNTGAISPSGPGLAGALLKLVGHAFLLGFVLIVLKSCLA